MATPVKEELVDYDDDEVMPRPQAVRSSARKSVQTGTYVGTHSSGFRDFLLKKELLRAISDCGFEHPSEIQQECIPQLITGVDSICQAKSGMGKTAVFVLATLQQLDLSKKSTLILVLGHSRELVFQIGKEYTRLAKHMEGVKIGSYYGGLPIARDIENIKAGLPNIVVGTPGRILALVREGHLPVGEVRHFVLDECDHLLNSLEIRRDVQEIFKATPRKKQVIMLSATLDDSVKGLCKKFMRNPFEIVIQDDVKLTLHGLTQHYVKLPENKKTADLDSLLDRFEYNQVIIFVSNTRRCEALSALLNEQEKQSICLHSRMPQEQRIKRYEDFKSFKSRIMVATDLLGRGIDIERVNVVINYDMPPSSDAYLHRVGRAGRFGTKGLAVSFVSTFEDSEMLNEVQERFDVSIEELPADVDPALYMTS